MDKSIIINNLSKAYRLGETHRENQIRDVLVNFIKNPLGVLDRNKEIFFALKNISFSVDHGEVLGIIGRNGAGKSTLLKVISKITYPTTGSVQFNGRMASLLEVGTGFHEELTGTENIYLNGSILGMKKSEINAKMDEIVAFADLDRFLDTPLKRYSSGMKLRLGFAVAAHLDPDILIVDEVLAVGDAEFQKKCLETMDDLKGGGKTVLFVSHNMAAIENLCQRTIWIDNGQVKMDGETNKVISSYMSTFSVTHDKGFDFSNFQDRKGNGDILIQSLDILSGNGNNLNGIRSGDKITARIKFHALKPVKFPNFGFLIYTNLGTLVSRIENSETGLRIPELPEGKGHIDINIDFLNLMPGHYNITLWVTDDSKREIDWLIHCASFNVEASDYYNTGKGIGSGRGIMVLPCQWNLEIYRD